ncbi:hypothetical protein [Nonomuraea sp. NPDC049400]|uniref:hypothetical protein n=1 Tax=Nonomuraea sp. NPDC049400 TaxID=3364352 RepID=UPI0037A2FE53
MNTAEELAPRLYNLPSIVSARRGERAVEVDHDNNQWRPLHVDDWRIRMLVTRWSTRVSHAVIDICADVAKKADAYGWEALASSRTRRSSTGAPPATSAAATQHYLHPDRTAIAAADSALSAHLNGRSTWSPAARRGLAGLGRARSCKRPLFLEFLQRRALLYRRDDRI